MPKIKLCVNALTSTPMSALMGIDHSITKLHMPDCETMFAAKVASITGVVPAKTENQKSADNMKFMLILLPSRTALEPEKSFDRISL